LSEHLFESPHTPLLIVISGPSGAGKDSVIARLKQRSHPFHFVVTATNRPKRPEEVDGRDYIFVSTEQFAEMIEHGELLEYAIVYGDYKGVPRQQVRQALASGLDVVMRLDVQGAETFRKLVPEAVLVFITPATEDDLVARLQARKTESPDALKIRIATARQELNRLEAFDYVVVNRQNKLDEAVDDVMGIIRAEHCRVVQRKVTL
jgi:guanylate kinase